MALLSAEEYRLQNVMQYVCSVRQDLVQNSPLERQQRKDLTSMQVISTRLMKPLPKARVLEDICLKMFKELAIYSHDNLEFFHAVVQTNVE